MAVAAVQSSRIGSLRAVEMEEQRSELDSHADTMVVGSGTALEIFDHNTPI